MSLYLLDTNILVGYIRGADFIRRLDEQYGISRPPNVALISVVSKGEMYSLAGQLKWKSERTSQLEEILSLIPAVDISDERILRRYAEIDIYSQGHDPSRALPDGMKSARNMAKNDLWIAATASILNAPLVTTDKDFTHLDGVFLKVIQVDQ